MKEKFFTISLEIFPYDVVVSYGQNDKQITNSLKLIGVDEESIKSMTECPPSTYSGLCLEVNKNLQTIIRIKKLDKWNKLSTVVHEVTHATIFIYEAMGTKLTMDSCEFYCYMNQYLVTEIMKKL